VLDTGPNIKTLRDPMFNARECCKELVLLEQHLLDTGKRCDDCIRKHFLTIEGLLEEATRLDKYGSYHFILHKKPDTVREITRYYITNKDYLGTAQRLRDVRKSLAEVSFGHFD